MEQYQKAGFAAAVAAGLTGFSSQAAADWYIGVAVGEVTIETEDTIEFVDFDFDESDTAFKLFGGYMFNEYLGVEVAYVDMGSPSGSFGFDGGESLEAEVSGFTAYGVANLPLGPIDLFAKVGALAWDADLTVSYFGNELSASDDGIDLAYGVGARYRFGNVGVRAEYEIFDIDGVDDVFMWSVGAEYRF
jgi:hypothetical protein